MMHTSGCSTSRGVCVSTPPSTSAPAQGTWALVSSSHIRAPKHNSNDSPHSFGQRWQAASRAMQASSRLSLLFFPQLWMAAPARAFGWGGGQGFSGSGGGGGGPPPSGAAKGAGSQEPIVLTLASFAVTKLAYVRLTKQFREYYLQRTGVDVRFRLTFAGSGVQARAVIDGLPADMVALALPLDINRIADAGLIPRNWPSRYPCKSTVCETTVALVVRQGNPKGIRDWEDLIRPGVEVVVANPKTAGVARWIFLALWGSQLKRKKKGGDAAAHSYVKSVFDNVVVQPRDAREASDVFYKQKVGDVLLTYENEVILTNMHYGEKALPYVVPPCNIRIECPVSQVDKVLETRPPNVQKAAVDFIEFLFTTTAQSVFGSFGFRVNPKISKQAAEKQVDLPPAKLWDVDSVFGGWSIAQSRFFDSKKILDGIQEEVGRKRVEHRKVAKAQKS